MRMGSAYRSSRSLSNGSYMTHQRRTNSRSAPTRADQVGKQQQLVYQHIFNHKPNLLPPFQHPGPIAAAQHLYAAQNYHLHHNNTHLVQPYPAMFADPHFFAPNAYHQNPVHHYTGSLPPPRGHYMKPALMTEFSNTANIKNTTSLVTSNAEASIPSATRALLKEENNISPRLATELGAKNMMQTIDTENIELSATVGTEEEPKPKRARISKTNDTKKKTTRKAKASSGADCMPAVESVMVADQVSASPLSAQENTSVTTRKTRAKKAAENLPANTVRPKNDIEQSSQRKRKTVKQQKENVEPVDAKTEEDKEEKSIPVTRRRGRRTIKDSAVTSDKPPENTAIKLTLKHQEPKEEKTALPQVSEHQSKYPMRRTRSQAAALAKQTSEQKDTSTEKEDMKPVTRRVTRRTKKELESSNLNQKQKTKRAKAKEEIISQTKEEEQMTKEQMTEEQMTEEPKVEEMETKELATKESKSEDPKTENSIVGTYSVKETPIETMVVEEEKTKASKIESSVVENTRVEEKLTVEDPMNEVLMVEEQRNINPERNTTENSDKKLLLLADQHNCSANSEGASVKHQEDEIISLNNEKESEDCEPKSAKRPRIEKDKDVPEQSIDTSKINNKTFTDDNVPTQEKQSFNKYDVDAAFMGSDSFLSDEEPVSFVDEPSPSNSSKFKQETKEMDMVTIDSKSVLQNYELCDEDRMSAENEKQVLNQIENWMMDNFDEKADLISDKPIDESRNDEEYISNGHKGLQTGDENTDVESVATNGRMDRIQLEIEAINLQFPELKNYYTLLDRAGRGTFSKVYKAQDLLYEKYMPWTLQKKLECAFEGDHRCVAIKGAPCITPMITAFRNEDVTYLVLPYIEFDHFEDIYPTMTLLDLKHYISELFIGLKHVHDKGIIHRDVKPGNFLYNRKTKTGYLGDFGLAQRSSTLEVHKPGHLHAAVDPIYTKHQDGPAGYFMHDKRKYISVDRSGTRSFRAPEIYLNSLRQTTGK
ncbi:hypothetical protein RO3G_01453 [Rhizopus delemar RA 99-880]|uniref:non-specific serine/threonine protein kinase n=1 Tax=Rhizopus delemar (strain RA 99-880 / ATCC MYA-4621 / FGSC 9543 / NRRL 43880) TaxID=246409 RepID=I1BKL9_RHIO9|nr:hypothetical protein RO3G_01453 [Rhizopus delemar RA 99-880]|eukprot:EIE76749.1 hypothetical protein RO3G_01453 [Rhizopus delemar RA 99-880]